MTKMPAEYVDPQAQIMEFITALSDSMEQAYQDEKPTPPPGEGEHDTPRDGRERGEGHCHGRRGGWGGRGRGGPPGFRGGFHGFGPRDGPHDGPEGPHGPGPWGPPPHGFHPHGPRDRKGPHDDGPEPPHGPGPWGFPGHEGHEGPWAGPHGFGPFGAFAWGQRGRGPWGGRGGWFGPGPRGRGRHHRDQSSSQEFEPSVDVFDTPTSYTVHVALPGAVKEDIGIHYDYDASELQISGVVHRPGDEDFLKTLVTSERSIGAFERKIKLGGEDSAVEADEITAKLENGVLEVVLPKKEKAPEPEKKKIEIA